MAWSVREAISTQSKTSGAAGLADYTKNGEVYASIVELLNGLKSDWSYIGQDL